MAFKDDMINKNFRVLFELQKGPKNLEDLARQAKLRTGQLRTPLKILQEKGLVKEDTGLYSLTPSEDTDRVLRLVQPWMSYFDGDLYEVAKDVAAIILTKSWEDVEVRDVLAVGSLLDNDSPDDIDMIVLHEGYRLREFSRDPYNEIENPIYHSDEKPSEKNRRFRGSTILRQLGYPMALTDSNPTMQYKASVFYHVLKRVEGLSFEVPEMLSDSQNEELSALFDLHVLSISLFEPDNLTRMEAVENCKDNRFWYQALKSGRLYDPRTHDFTMPLEDKYPGAIELFNPANLKD